MSTDKLRAEFEAWAGGPEFGLSPAHFSKDERGEYINMPTDAYWLCFRAGRASAVVELPAIEAWDNDGRLDREQDEDARERTGLCPRIEVRIALEQAGVTVK